MTNMEKKRGVARCGMPSKPHWCTVAIRHNFYKKVDNATREKISIGSEFILML